MPGERDAISDIVKGWSGAAGAKLGSINCFFILCLLFHMWDVLTDFRELSARIVVYILLLIIGWLTIFKKEQGVMDIADLKMPIILSTLAFFIPYLGNVIPFFARSQTFHTMIIFLPVWVIYVGFAMQETKFIVFFRWVLIFFWLILFLPSIFIGISTDFHIRDIESTVNVQQTIVDATRDWGSNFKRFWKNVLDIPARIGKEFQHMIMYATGDYYTGKVDEYEKEPIGVYLEDLESTDPVFFQGENITVWGTLKAKTLDDKINIKVSCYAKEGSKEVMGNVMPTEFNIYDEEIEDISCVFSDLKPGKKDVVFNAEFNFETMAYLKLYFINRETLRGFKRDNIDVFDFYDIDHINPVAIYTNGPIRMGMGIKKELPIGVDTDEENIPFSLGITLQNDWGGIIKDVTELNVYLHDSMGLIRCDHEFENMGHVDEEQASYNVYSLVVPNRRTQNISDYETITCSVNVLDPESLLGGEGIITRYFRVSTKYIYELEKSTSVEVEETEGYEAAPDVDELKEVKESEEIKKECDSIENCDDYNNEKKYYDLYDFSTRTWCEADPCGLKNCYWDETKMKCMEKEEEELEEGEGMEKPVTKITATKEQIDNYLKEKAGPKLKDAGDIFYEYGNYYGIDPAFAIAVSKQETSLSKDTCASISQDCNNFFCMTHDAAKITDLSTGTCGTWASFSSVDDGIRAFYIYIKEGYLEREKIGEKPQTTPAEITCASGSGFTTHCYCGTTLEEHDDWATKIANFREEVSS